MLLLGNIVMVQDTPTLVRIMEDLPAFFFGTARGPAAIPGARALATDPPRDAPVGGAVRALLRQAEARRRLHPVLGSSQQQARLISAAVRSGRSARA